MRKTLFLLFTIFIFFACEKEVKEYKVTSINIEKTEETIFVGEKHKLSVVHLPSEANAPDYTWSVSGLDTDTTSVIEIDQNGNIIAKREGIANATAVALQIRDDNGITLRSTCRVNVIPVEIEKIKLEKNSISIDAGDSIKLAYTTYPDNATHKEGSWSTSNANIAIAENGYVKGIGVGEAEITISASNSTVKDVCKVKVNAIKAKGFELKENEITINRTESSKLTPVFNPVNTTNKTIIWSSSDEKIAIVDDLGNITTKSIGTCTINAVTKDGGYKASCKITVMPKPIEKIEFELPSYKIGIGEQEQLKIIFTPADADNKNIKWYSDDIDIAEVGDNGIVKGNSRGTTSISVITEDKRHQTSCEIRVVDLSDYMSLRFSSSSASIINGFVVGSIYSELTNSSDKTITIVDMTVFDGSNGLPVASASNLLPRQLNPGEKMNLGSDSFKMVYYPIFMWQFECEGKIYTTGHQFGRNYDPFVAKTTTNMKSHTFIELKQK